MTQKWFISWCEYTSSDAGGFNVSKYGSSIKDYPSEMTPDEVFHEVEEILQKYLQTDHVQITAFNRV